MTRGKKCNKTYKEGSYGKVAIDDTKAIKSQLFIEKNDITPASIAESSILTSISHPNIVKGKLRIEKSKLFIEMKRYEPGPITPSNLLKLIGVAASLEASSIYHNDLREDNIMFEGEEPIIIDFGLTIFDSKNLYVHSKIYASPEEREEKKTKIKDEKSDVWCLAVSVLMSRDDGVEDIIEDTETEDLRPTLMELAEEEEDDEVLKLMLLPFKERPTFQELAKRYSIPYTPFIIPIETIPTQEEMGGITLGSRSILIGWIVSLCVRDKLNVKTCNMTIANINRVLKKMNKDGKILKHLGLLCLLFTSCMTERKPIDIDDCLKDIKIPKFKILLLAPQVYEALGMTVIRRVELNNKEDLKSQLGKEPDSKMFKFFNL